MVSRENEWAIRSRRVVLPDGVRPAKVIVRGETISAIVDHDATPFGVPVRNVGDKYILPGLVDAHVHINEPGRTEWEGFESATRAAAAGGVTTLIDMPLNSSPVTTTLEALHEKQAAAAGKLWVDSGFHGGIVPGNVEQVRPLIAAGVCAFKAFLCHSGIDEFPNANEQDLHNVMPKLAAAGVPLLVHAELVGPLPNRINMQFQENHRSYNAWLAMGPAAWEVDAIKLMIALCRRYRCHVHVVHLSASCEAREMIVAGREEGLPLSIETCPHYLFFAAEDIVDGDSRFKCAPPIRSRLHQDLLRQMLRRGEIDTVGSDHSPAPAELKHSDLTRAWGGIASLQLLLPATWTAVPDESIFKALTERPAALVGLCDRKGRIEQGCDADLVVFDPDAEFVVNEVQLHHKHKWSPYHGQRLRGVVETTYLRGKQVYNNDVHVGDPAGQLLKRKVAQ